MPVAAAWAQAKRRRCAMTLASRMGFEDAPMMLDRELTCLAPPGTPRLPLHAVRPNDVDSVLATLAPGQAAFLRAGGFTGAVGQLALLPGGDGLAGAVFGLGADPTPWPFGALPMALPEGTAWRLDGGGYQREAAVLGFCLGAYQYSAYSQPKRGPALLAD